MCWMTSECFPDTLREKVADEDIVVYKVLRGKEDGRLFSYFTGFEYEPWKVYSICEKMVPYDDKNGNISICIGFHSYDGRCIVDMRTYNDIGIYAIDKLHRDKGDCCRHG